MEGEARGVTVLYTDGRRRHWPEAVDWELTGRTLDILAPAEDGDGTEVIAFVRWQLVDFVGFSRRSEGDAEMPGRG